MMTYQNFKNAKKYRARQQAKSSGIPFHVVRMGDTLRVIPDIVYQTWHSVHDLFPVVYTALPPVK